MKPAISKYMASIGARGGSVTSEAKARAARENGKKGGGKRKTKPTPEPPSK